MLQLNFVFDIIIDSRRITVSESFYCIRYVKRFIRVSLNKSTWELIYLPLKAFSQLKDLIAKFMALILGFS